MAHAADIDWDGRTIRMAEWLREPAYRKKFPNDLEDFLRHELLHALLERRSDMDQPHYNWTFSHNQLARITRRLDQILRTGNDDPS